MAQLSIEPVLLAHPMESTRRTSLRRQQRIAALLLDRDNEMLAPNEQRALLQRIRAEVSADWQTEEHPRERLTVADEREHAIFYLVEILYQDHSGVLPGDRRGARQALRRAGRERWSCR